jgi:hypothetical protein
MLAMLLGQAGAGPQESRDALERLQEVVQLRLEEGVLRKEKILPALLVSAQPRYAESQAWFATQAIASLQGALGPDSLRLCEACMAPRAYVHDGSLSYQTGPIGLDEIARLDDQLRGTARAAKTAIWVDETGGGVSVRIVDLSTGNILLAQNLDPSFDELRNTERMYTLSEELERRSRGGSLTQAFLDLGLLPSQHVSFDWTDQFGARNRHMAGVTLSLFDPIFGVGGNYHYVTPLFDTAIGVKGILSVPRLVLRAADSLGGGDTSDPDVPGLDPLITGVFVARVPFGRSNYGLFGSVSTNGRVTFGISLMNISLIPVIP